VSTAAGRQSRRWSRPTASPLLGAILLIFSVTLVSAQELEPGSYQNAPTGVNVAIASMGFSSGNVLFDASLPVANVHAEVEVLGLGYVRTLGILGPLTQSALSFAKARAIWTFGRSLWLAASYGRATGGQTRVEGAVTNSVQRNDRLGATLVVPVHKSAAIRVVYTSGLSTRTGADFDSIAFGGQYTWFKRRAPAPTVDRASLAASPGWRDIP
jgi:hypothetical protein